MTRRDPGGELTPIDFVLGAEAWLQHALDGTAPLGQAIQQARSLLLSAELHPSMNLPHPSMSSPEPDQETPRG